MKSPQFLITRIPLPFAVLFLAMTMSNGNTKAQTIPDTSRMEYNQISQELKLYVYPSKGQSKQKQKSDEFKCYQWAQEQSGIDPLNLPKVEPAPVESHVGSKTAKGAGLGAAAGAAIGAIAGDWGAGAAIGAISGGALGIRKGRKAKKEETEQAQASASAQEQEMKNSFLKAFTACIEGKGYTIK